jgi:allantoinase
MILSGPRVVLPQGIGPATIHIRDGLIEQVERGKETRAPGVEHFPDHVLLPGLVDSHVHVNEPGHTDWEGFATAGDAAVAGGITTIVDMPLNSLPVTVDADALELKRADALSGCRADFAFWGGVIPGGERNLEPLVAAGARGFKAFLCPSGLDEFPPADEETLRNAMRFVARLGLPLLVHAEDPQVLARAFVDAVPRDPASAAGWAATRPPEAEVRAVQRLVELSMETGARVHVVHVSAAGTLAVLAAARAEGVAITAETCPHYLTFTINDVEDGDTRFKCAPPLRSDADRTALWEALRDGTLDLVASDHSPCPPSLKRPGDFETAWGGIASLQLGLPAVWTGARERGFGLEDVAGWMARAPAELAGLERKGALAAGCDADIVLFDPEQTFVVEPAMLKHRHRETAWQGRTLRGTVKRTWRRGRVVFDDGKWPGIRDGREAG